MRKCQRLFREEQQLAWRGTENLDRVYANRQQRLELMATQVVTIEACGGMGSGVMLDDRGYIATNAHVISNGQKVCSPIEVSTASGWRGQAEMMSGEFEQDIAIIKVEANEEFQGVEIASKLYLGQDVYAVGHPLGRSHTVTRGIISFPRRQANNRPYIQIDAAINPGNSGGGLFDELGRLLGLPTFKEVWADNKKSVPVANIGFAVPADIVNDYYHKAFQRQAEKCSGEPQAAVAAFVIS